MLVRENRAIRSFTPRLARNQFRVWNSVRPIHLFGRIRDHDSGCFANYVELDPAECKERLYRPQRALQIAKRSFPNSHVYPRSLETLALLREQHGRMEEALALYREAVAIFEQQYGYPSYQTMEGLYRQSGQLIRAGKLGDAEKAIRRVTEAMDEIDGVSDFEKSDYLATLAAALAGLGRKLESEEAGKRSRELLERARKEAEAE